MRRVQLKSLMCATCYVCVRVLEMITCNVHNSLKAFSQILFLTLSDNVVADTCTVQSRIWCRNCFIFIYEKQNQL